MSQETKNTRPITPLAWLLAVLALVPVAGIIFGLMAFEWGMRTRAGGGRRLAFVAALALVLGVAVTIAGYTYRADILASDGDSGNLQFGVPQGSSQSGK